MRTMLLAAAAMLAVLPPSPAPACACGKLAPGGQRLAGATAIGPGTTIVPIRLRSGAASPTRPVLVIEGLGYARPPAALYRLRLRGPDGRTAPLGVINFYNETAPDAPHQPRFAFDAADALDRIGGEADALLFEATSGVTGVAPDPEARVRFERLSLERR
ncbi:hypothetical protein E2493_19385 [Sphingomonas parva]|uniref:DUF2141 domain-containing protein n=1 Tax=Sphingomonas parva TaxID=2555898 RepID=A0A4Y8ZMC2_9SPHN|nr:hypothetical protein [Sphingomonas parva]TFI56607.1 hypothetical protein E2493_19385 [Sphingomonas parva]